MKTASKLFTIFFSLVLSLFTGDVSGSSEMIKGGWRQVGLPLLISRLVVRDQSNWMAGTLDGQVFWTTNGGRTWSVIQPEFYSMGLAGAYLQSPTNMWCVGPLGTVFHSTDGGKTWDQRPLKTRRNLNSVHFFDPQVGIIFVGGQSTTDTEWGDSSVLRTTDAGATWNFVTTELQDIVMASAYHRGSAWAIDLQGEVYRSENRGISWAKLTRLPLFCLDVQFLDARTGWAVGDDRELHKSAVMKTRDGGESWPRLYVSDSRLSSISFADQRLGWAAGENGVILHSRDGGVTWSPQATGSKSLVKDIHAFGTKHALAAKTGESVIGFGSGWSPSIELPPEPNRTILAEIKHQISQLGGENRQWLNAAFALGDLGAAAVPALQEELLSADAKRRGRAAYSLGFVGTDAEPAVPNIIRLLRDVNDAVRWNATYALGRIGRPADKIVSALQGVILDDRDPKVRAQAAGSLCLMKDHPAVLPSLLTALDDSSPQVRFEAGKAISCLEGAARSAVPRLIEVLLNDKEEDPRVGAAIALNGIGPQAAMAVFALTQSLLRDPAQWVRRHSAEALGNIGDDSAIPALEKAAKVDPSLFVRGTASRALEQLKDSQ